VESASYGDGASLTVEDQSGPRARRRRKAEVSSDDPCGQNPPMFCCNTISIVKFRPGSRKFQEIRRQYYTTLKSPQWGGPPGPLPTPWSACSNTGRAGPGGPARTPHVWLRLRCFVLHLLKFFSACDDSVGQAGSLRPSGTRPAFGCGCAAWWGRPSPSVVCQPRYPAPG
jgi:hypothetical protein